MTTEMAKATKDFPAILAGMKGQIALALPKHMTADRMMRIALTCYRSTPKLAECEPMSIIAAVVQCSQLGLEPGLMGQAYLIPFNRRAKINGTWQTVKECQFMPGYRGLVSLARRTGEVTSINAEIVYEHDEFELTLGADPKIVHKPNLDGDRGKIRLVYAIAKFKDGGYHFDWMTIEAIEKIRTRNDEKNAKYQQEGEKKKETPWDTDYEEMVKKTMIRRICKMLPMSVELAQAVAVNDAVDMGKRAVIEGDFVSVIEPEDATGSEIETTGGEQTAGASTGQQEEAKPLYTEEEFNKRLPTWEKLIKEGKKTADEVIVMAETRSTFSVDQKQILKDIKPEAQA